MTHEVSPILRLGSLLDARLSCSRADWIAAGGGGRARGGLRAHLGRAQPRRPAAAVYWYDEVAARTRRGAEMGPAEPARQRRAVTSTIARGSTRVPPSR